MVNKWQPPFQIEEPETPPLSQILKFSNPPLNLGGVETMNGGPKSKPLTISFSESDHLIPSTPGIGSFSKSVLYHLRNFAMFYHHPLMSSF